MYFKNIRHKDFLSYFSIIAVSFSQPINGDIKERFFNLNFNFKESMLWVFFPSYVQGRKERIHYPKNLLFDVGSKHNQLNSKVKAY
jgi:hypothetical protein